MLLILKLLLTGNVCHTVNRVTPLKSLLFLSNYNVISLIHEKKAWIFQFLVCFYFCLFLFSVSSEYISWNIGKQKGKVFTVIVKLMRIVQNIECDVRIHHKSV